METTRPARADKHALNRSAPPRPAQALIRSADGGSRLSLTPREFALLHFFMRHRDQVLSKNEILENVWDTNYDRDDNLVEVYVGYLRRKIDAPFGRHSIDTVRGVGYRMVGTGG